AIRTTFIVRAPRAGERSRAQATRSIANLSRSPESGFPRPCPFGMAMLCTFDHGGRKSRTEREVIMRIAVLGGTGPEGLGLAARLAQIGEAVVIGSPSAPAADEAAETSLAQ